MGSKRNPQVLGVKMRLNGLPRPISLGVKRTIDRLLSFDRFNAFYSGLPDHEPLEFSRTFLDAMDVRLELVGLPVETIPTSGPLLVIANHPFGLIEGMALDALLLSRRTDVRLMAIYNLAAIPEWSDRFIWVDQRGGRRSRKLNMQGWRQCYRWLDRSGALVIFPAGRVAHFELRRFSVTERPWSSHIGAIARRTKVSVLPVFFAGHNSWTYQLAGLACPPLRNFLLINEATSQQRWRLPINIGPLIEPEELSGCATDEEATQFMRQAMAKLAHPQSNWH